MEVDKNSQIPTAANAKELTEMAIKVKTDEKVKEINKLIREAISKGEFDVYYYKDTSSYVIQYLRELGYTLTNEGDQRDGYYLRISWR